MKPSASVFTLTCFGVTLGFSIQGLEFMFILISVYWILAGFDTLTRFVIERRRKNVNSARFGDGILKRLIKSVLALSLLVLVSHIQYTFPADDCGAGCILIALLPCIVMAFFLLEEVISLLENAIELTDDQNKTLIVLRNIFGISLKKGLNIAEQKVKKSLEK